MGGVDSEAGIAVWGVLDSEAGVAVWGGRIVKLVLLYGGGR